MVTEDQSAVEAFLSSPTTHGEAAVERIDTHTAVVFLVGARALKLKRAVKYDYLDFSTTERRRGYVEAEVRLNRRTAPSLYLGVRAVTRERDGSLAMDGAGEPVDWLVEMARFPQDQLFDRLAAAGRLDVQLMPQLAAAVAALHQTAEPTHGYGGRAGMEWVIDGNASGLREFGGTLFDLDRCDRLCERQRQVLAGAAAVLDARRDQDLVRHCHGDLHLGNVVLLEGVPTLFDGIEFNDAIACVDVGYDAAFLVMDLWHRRLTRHANVFLNRYLVRTGDVGVLSLLPLFLSCRATVRAKTSATAVGLQPDEAHRRAFEDLAREYLDLAWSFIEPVRPRIVAVGGYSGSGKSTIAAMLAPALGPAPGAVVLRSDEIRKRILGVDPLTRLGPDGYTGEVSARVYRELAARARTMLDAGHSVVVDAVFGDTENRQAMEELAAAQGVPFTGLWLDAPEQTLLARVRERRDDASDADAAVVRAQCAGKTGAPDWARVDASGTPDEVIQQARAAL